MRSAAIDIVVVSYNSRRTLRSTIEPLCALDDANVIIVDNASADGGVETIRDLDVAVVAQRENRGFAAGCNVGWRSGQAEYVLLLNPDTLLDAESLRRLARALDEDPRAGAVAPRIVNGDGTLEYSRRRFPRLLSTYAQALFFHRLFPQATWTDEVERDTAVYDQGGTVDWVSGACILVRRTILEHLSGLDERFFMYCEDIDLCRRIWASGSTVRYEPEAVMIHEGGASAPRASLLPVLAASRLRYGQLHFAPPAAVANRIGVALSAFTHAVVSTSPERRRGHLGALRAATRRTDPAKKLALNLGSLL